MQELGPVGALESRRGIIKNVLVLGHKSEAATWVQCEHTYGLEEDEQLQKLRGSSRQIKWNDKCPGVFSCDPLVSLSRGMATHDKEIY